MPKILAFVSLLLFFFTTTNAQKCAYISNTVSGMDGTLQVITQPEYYSQSNTNGELQVWSKVHMDTSVVLSLTVNTPKVSNIKEVDHVKIMLENDKAIQLQLMNKINPSERKVEKFTIYAVVSKNNQELLLASRSTEVRISSGEDSLIFTPGNKREASAIRKVLSCVIDILTDRE